MAAASDMNANTSLRTAAKQTAPKTQVTPPPLRNPPIGGAAKFHPDASSDGRPGAMRANKVNDNPKPAVRHPVAGHTSGPTFITSNRSLSSRDGFDSTTN